MAWQDLAANEVPDFADIEDAEATGELELDPIPPGTYAANETWTRQDFETHAAHKSMSGSGIASNELMTRGEMETWRAPPTPEDFNALHDTLACPNIAVDLSWDNAGRSQQKVLEWWDGISAWQEIAQPSAAATSFRHDGEQGGPDTGHQEWRIRWISANGFAETSENVLCPT